jgi:hypothetical protein
MRRAFLAGTLPQGRLSLGRGSSVVMHGAGGAVGTTGAFRSFGFHGPFDAARQERRKGYDGRGARRAREAAFPEAQGF